MTDLILQTLLRATVLLLIAFAVTMYFRKRSAATRHAIWAGAMFGLLVLPFLSPFLPSVSLLTQKKAQSETVSENLVTPPVVPIEMSNPPHEFSSETIVADAPNMEKAPQVEPATEDVGVMLGKSIVRTKWQYRQRLIAGILLGVWGIIALGRCCGIVFSVRSAKRLARECAGNDWRLQQTLDRLQQAMRMQKFVHVVAHKKIPVPFAIGVRRPVIMLPAEANEWPQEELDAVLTHELAHVTRRDVLWQYVAKLAAAVYWFHPLVWLAIWRMHIERELACDDAVIYHGHSPEHYASTLLELAAGIKSRNKALPACAVAMARKNIVRQRIVSILSPKLNRKPLGRVKTLLLGVIGLAVIVLVASLTLFGKAKPVGFLNLDAMTNDHSIKGEKNAQTIDASSDIANTMARVTGKKWSCTNSYFSMGSTEHNLMVGQIRVFSAGANKPLFSGSSWYRITVDDGVLIEAASEKGFNKAAEHFAELIEFEDNRPRIAKGEYTAWHRKKTLTLEETMNLTAIRRDAEKVKFTGQITMPDGKPVRNIGFDVSDFAIMRGNDGHYTYGSGCAVSRPDGYPVHTDDNGQFDFEVIPGCILIVGVYRDPVDGNLISVPICFTPDYFSNQPLNIKLQPGVPVTVRAKHEDGSPVEDVTVGWIRPYPSPIKTYGDTNIDGNCNTQNSKPLTDGEVTFYLAPGEYELNVQSNSHLYFDVPKTLTVTEGGHYEFEHTIPHPARVRLLQINGDPLANREIKLMHVGQKQEGRMPAEIVDVRTDTNGIVPVYLWDESNYVFATSEDERFGIIKSLSHDDAGKTIDITLERSTEFLAHIRNRNTQKPVANKEFQCQIGIATLGTVRHGHVTFANKFKTNNDGAARFFLPPIPEGDPYLEYEPLLGHPLDVRRTDSAIDLTIDTTEDD